MVDFVLSGVAVTVTPPIGPSSAEETTPARAGTLPADDGPLNATAAIPASRMAAKCLVDIGFLSRLQWRRRFARSQFLLRKKRRRASLAGQGGPTRKV